jgi:TolB-like protein/tetratricopeptide (TPR) repeat protein
MGEVWKARDTRLGRIVAIKKVKEQHSERFKQEARSIAALNHPHICQLYDVGPDYLVLEYVEGKSLSSPLPEREAVRLAIQIATALEEAHQKGIIHRDLKPSNIMVTDKGSVKLLGFGLAKLYEQDASISASPTADFPATQAGAFLGTVAYMSPEQAQGQTADTRSDIFSFGLVLYEMLSGRRAFSGENSLAILAAIQKSEPLPLQSSRSLEKIVRRCLAKQPLGRYQTMSEVKAALEQIVAEKPAVTAAEAKPSIAVLPFVNMSGDKEQEYFSDGLAEEIINALAQIPGLKVIARTSAFAFRGKEQDITKIAEALRVRTILEGSVRKSGNHIRITAQLIDAADGSHLWSERYDRELTDVFAIQDEISRAIAEKLRVGMSGSRTMVKRPTENMEAYNFYLIGRYHFLKYTPEGMAKSKEYFEKALELDPHYALAWFGLANLYRYLTNMGLMTHSQFHQATLRALELDKMLPQAHAMMAVLRANQYEWKEAELEFDRVLELGPESAEVFEFYSGFYPIPLGPWDEAIEWTRRAIELDPLSQSMRLALGIIFAQMHRFDLAIEQFRKVLELNPHFFQAQINLGRCYIQSGKRDEAIRALETAAQLSERSSLALGSLGYALAQMGRVGEARKVLEELQERARKSHVPGSVYALIYMGFGEIDKAFDWFEKAIEERDFLICWLVHSSDFDPLRSHPRYHALIGSPNFLPEGI